jgi:ABC-type transporter Mla subunit MlaD
MSMDSPPPNDMRPSGPMQYIWDTIISLGSVTTCLAPLSMVAINSGAARVAFHMNNQGHAKTHQLLSELNGGLDNMIDGLDTMNDRLDNTEDDLKAIIDGLNRLLEKKGLPTC